MINRFVSVLVTALPLMATTTLYAQDAALARSTTATVTGVDVAAEVMRLPVEQRTPALTQVEAVRQLASNLLVRRTLASEAERDGIANDPLVIAAIQIAKDRVLSDVRLARLDAQNEPSSASLEAYVRSFYNANPEKFISPSQTRASHILLKNTGPESLAEAKKLLEQLRSGASFEEAAKAKSDDPGSAAKGGDLGFFGPGQMVRPFEDAVNALTKPGDLSEPVESQFGYHIIRLDQRRPQGPKAFEEVKAQLMAEARTSLLNKSRVQKVESMNKEFSFDAAAIEAFAKSNVQK